MIESGSYARGFPTRRWIGKPHFSGFVTDLVGSRGREEAPQAYLVEQPAGFDLQPHFHLRHQFQVVVSGSGKLGPHPVGPLTVHYASAYSGYGPLCAGAQGLWYLTLRARCDNTTAWFLPQSRDRMRRDAPRQQAYGSPACSISGEHLRVLPDIHAETLIPLDDGGLGAWLLRLPPQSVAEPPPGAERGGGRFYVLTQGSLVLPDGAVEGLATVFAPPDESLALHSGKHGAEVVVVQYPAAALHAA